jgi:glucoamylase
MNRSEQRVLSSFRTAEAIFAGFLAARAAAPFAIQAIIRSSVASLGIAGMAAALAASLGSAAIAANATDCCGAPWSWTSGNKVAVGTAADRTTASRVLFTVANGITTEVFYPRLDIPNMQDMQYVVTDGSTFVDLERDATNHVVSMPDEKALEYAITNTAKSGKYKITNTYITDPARNTLMIQTRFQSLAGGPYQLYILENPSMVRGGDDDNALWDGADGALLSSGTETLYERPPTTVFSALESSTGFIAHDDGYVGAPSDCYQDLNAHQVLSNQFDGVSAPGNVVQCGQVRIGSSDVTFTLALGYGGNAAAAVSAAGGSLAAGFADRAKAYRGVPPYTGGWNGYVNSLKAAPSSVSGSATSRRAYYVAAMALHAAEDKGFPGATIAGFAQPWGQANNEAADGYHRVWGRDLYEQATGLIADGDTAQALRMAQFLWSKQYQSGSLPFPRYSPVGGSADGELGCCEQLDQDGFAIILAWMTGLTDAATYAKINAVANHIVNGGPATTERWEELYLKSPSSIAAEIAGLVAAADIARQNSDAASAATWESTADAWRDGLRGWTFTTDGIWDNRNYFIRGEAQSAANPNDGTTICTAVNGTADCYFEHDITDGGFLDLVRLGVRLPSDADVAASLPATDTAFDDNSAVKVTLANGDVYFHRYPHDHYGESSADGSGWQGSNIANKGRLWPVLSGERGEYALANAASAALFLQSMADAVNDGYFVPEQVWDKADAFGFVQGKPTNSAAPLNWAEGQYLRLAQSIALGINFNVDTPTVVAAKYRGAGKVVGNGGKCIDDAGASTANGSRIQLWSCNGTGAQSWTWNSSDGTLQALGKCMDVTGGATANGTKIQLWDCNGTPAQQWRWRSANSLVNPQSGRCLEDTSGNTGNGTQLAIEDCSSGNAQAWYLPM